MKTFLLLILTLLAFAGNSVLNRLALKGEYIDAESFTIIRLVSGAIALLLISFFQAGAIRCSEASLKGDYKAPVALFLYAFCFSVAYLSLNTGTGALILFGMVQVLLLSINFLHGNKLSEAEWVGVILALSGLIVLLLPGAAAPNLVGFILMCIAGISWGLYTWWGRGSQQPLADTTNNFFKTLPLCGLLIVWLRPWAEPLVYSNDGVWLAVVSGAVTSGVGYALWYAVLPKLSLLQSALSQLLVPVIAAAAGILFLGEHLTWSFITASILILGGILLIQLPKFSRP